MANTIDLNSGQTLTYFSDYDLAQYIRDDYSRDIGDLVEDMVIRIDKDEFYAKEAIQTDLLSYETQLDFLYDRLRDIDYQLEQAINQLLGGKKKNEVIAKLSKIREIIKNL